MANNTGNDALAGGAKGAAAGAAAGPWGALIGGALGAVGGLVGGAAQDRASSAAEAQYKEMMDRIAAVQTPDIEQQRINLAQYLSGGKLTPEQEQAQQLASADAYQNIQVDPRLKQAQMQNLQLLQRLGESGGYSPIEAAQLSAMERKVEADNASRLKAMLEQQEARGMGSSDAGLAARMIESQSAANRQAEQSQNIAAQGMQRALAAMSGAGSLAGQMGQQEYQQGANLANSLNQREQFNTLQRAGVNQRNVGEANAAQKFNLANSQEIANKNVDLANQQQQYNKQLLQQRFNNQMSKATGMNNAGAGMPKMISDSGASQAGRYATIGQGLGTAAYGYFGQKNPVDNTEDTINQINKMKGPAPDNDQTSLPDYNSYKS